jgi:hypothetical protein
MNNASGEKDHERFKPLLKSHSRDHNDSQNKLTVSGRMSVKRMDSRQSIARGPEISIDTKGIDIDDKLALSGERKSTYFANDLNPVLEEILRLEKTHFRLRTIFVVLVPFFSISIIALLRGSKNMDSIVKIGRCSIGFYLLLAAQVAILLVLAIINIVLLKKEYNVKMEHDYQFVKGDIVWNTRSIIKFIIFAIVAGFISGAIGLSGGILFTPLFLEFGIAPTVASGTSMYMAMFATLSSSILFMFAGTTIYPFAFWLSAYSIIGTAAGITIIGTAIKKTGKTSLLVWLLAFVILISFVAETATGILSIIGKFRYFVS